MRYCNTLQQKLEGEETVTVAEIVKRRIGSPVFQVIFNCASNALTTSSQLNSSNFVSVEDVTCLQITLSLTPFHGGVVPSILLLFPA
jgi:hypothetical protein